MADPHRRTFNQENKISATSYSPLCTGSKMLRSNGNKVLGGEVYNHMNELNNKAWELMKSLETRSSLFFGKSYASQTKLPAS